MGELWAEGERWAGCGVQAQPGQLAQAAELAGGRSGEHQQLREQGGAGEGRTDRGGGATNLGCREAAEAARALRSRLPRTPEMPACMHTHQACKQVLWGDAGGVRMAVHAMATARVK